jgi:limonene 1,2-monooxygenase
MIRVDDYVQREKRLRSYELFARYVMPHFQGSLSGIMASNRWASERKDALHGHAIAGLKQATDAYFSRRN